MGELHAIGPRAKLVEHLERLTTMAREGKLKAIVYGLVLDSWMIRPGWYGVGEPDIPLPLLGYAMRASVNYVGDEMDKDASSGGEGG